VFGRRGWLRSDGMWSSHHGRAASIRWHFDEAGDGGDEEGGVQRVDPAGADVSHGSERTGESFIDDPYVPWYLGDMDDPSGQG